MSGSVGTKAAILRAYWQARRRRRWSRGDIERHQLAGMRALPGLGSAVSLDDALACLPVLSPSDFNAEFLERNALGLSLEEARHRAAYEVDTGVSPEPGYSFGFSTGSTGEPGVFITTAGERAQWVGTVLGKLLSWPAFLRPGGLDIALLLKHNSRLYTDVTETGRLRLQYFDVADQVSAWAPKIAALRPRILVAPPSALLDLVDALTGHSPSGGVGIQPRLVLAVGEPLFPADRATLGGAFDSVPRSLYQAKEGFLATGCARGRLHLNEDLQAFELAAFPDQSEPREGPAQRESADRARGDAPRRLERAVPVFTDFTRTSQSYWRYRMDDVVLVDPSPCPCGSRYTSLAAVEGRLTDVLLRRDDSPVFPLELDALLARHLPAGARSAVTQEAPGRFTLALDGEPSAPLLADLRALLGEASFEEWRAPATIEVTRYAPPPRGEKLRRFRRLFDPRSEILTRSLLPPLRPLP